MMIINERYIHLKLFSKLRDQKNRIMKENVLNA